MFSIQTIGSPETYFGLNSSFKNDKELILMLEKVYFFQQCCTCEVMSDVLTTPNEQAVEFTERPPISKVKSGGWVLVEQTAVTYSSCSLGKPPVIHFQTNRGHLSKGCIKCWCWNSLKIHSTRMSSISSPNMEWTNIRRISSLCLLCVL